jgi:hypothetical protein
MQIVGIEPIETERLLLSPLRPEHAAQIWEVEPALYTWIPRDPRCCPKVCWNLSGAISGKVEVI